MWVIYSTKVIYLPAWCKATIWHVVASSEPITVTFAETGARTTTKEINILSSYLYFGLKISGLTQGH